MHNQITQDNGPNKQAEELAVFPLKLFILPQGRQRLRIFEAKYVSMVGTIRSDEGFVIACPDASQPFGISNWGTLVKIVDFHIGDDGLLLIDVEGQQIVSLQNHHYQSDGLLVATPTEVKHWDNPTGLKPNSTLAETLQRVFKNYDYIADLYTDTHFEKAEWVCSRLIEVMPVALDVKEKFIEPDSFPQLVTFLLDLIEESRN